MASLSPKGRALIRAGRRALRATPADRERLESALRARLGAEALPLQALTAPPSPRAGWYSLPKLATVACLVGGALVVALGPRASTPPARPAVHAPRSNPTGAPEHQHEQAVAAAAPVPASTPTTTPAPQRRPDPLAQEVALLTRAAGALRAGRAHEALRVLDVHQRRFPTGILTEERRAAKAQALCLVGRVREGRAELSRLAPASPAAARAEQVCATLSPAKQP